MSERGEEEEQAQEEGQEEQAEDQEGHEEEAEVSQQGTKRRRRPSWNNPKIKPRQQSAASAGNQSSLAFLAKQAQDVSKKNQDFSDPAHQMFQPKNNFINILLIQHLLNSGFENTAKTLQTEAQATNKIKQERIELTKMRTLKAVFGDSLSQGKEAEFFEARKSLHDELNYYVLDMDLSLELELKTRVYFALYYLIFLQQKRLDPAEAKKLTAERMVGFKNWCIEKGSEFGEDEDLKEYLKIPLLLDSMPGTNKLLDFVLSEDFAVQIVEQNHKEIDKVIFYANEVVRHRSFITKIYEFFVKYHPDASQSEIHKGIYSQVEAMIDAVKGEANKYQAEQEELDQLVARIEELSQTTKNRFKDLYDAQIEKLKANKQQDLGKLASVVQVSTRQKGIHAQYKRKWDELQTLEKELADAIGNQKKAATGGFKDEVGTEGEAVFLDYWTKKIRFLELKLKKVMLDMKKPEIPAKVKVTASN